MKIMYVLLASKGGLPHYTAELANSMTNYADITILKSERTTADKNFSDKVKIINAFLPSNLSFVDIYKGTAISLNTLRSIFSQKKLTLIETVDPDIIHFSGGISLTSQLFLYLYKIDKKYPIVVTFHDVLPKKLFLIPGRDVPFWEPLLNIIAVNVQNLLNLFPQIVIFNKIIVHTPKNKAELIKRKWNPEKIHIIPHGAYRMFGAHSNYGDQLPVEENTLLFFGNIVSSKAIDVLIAAVPLIVPTIPDIKVIVAGDGIIPKKSIKIIEEHQSHFEIHNTFIENEKVADFFCRTSLVVIPNRSQGGHSGTLTIAYSFGKPVVTTNVGDFSSLVESSGCGITVPPEDSQALADAIIKLLKDHSLREKMGKQAFQKAQELSWDTIAQMHMAVYHEIVNDQ